MITKDEHTVTIVPDFKAESAPQGISFDEYFSKEKLQSGEGGCHVGRISNRDLFSRYRDEPVYLGAYYIKDAGELSLTMPRAYEQFAEAIEKIANFEAAHSPFMLYKRAMLTIRQDVLKPGHKLDSLQWHRDRADMRRDNRKSAGPFVDHIYTVSDRFPTLLQKEAVPREFLQKAGTLTKYFNDNAYMDDTFVNQAEPYQINVMTNYCAHSSVPAEKEALRTFLRVTYTSPAYETLEGLPREKKQALGLKMF